MIIHDYRSLSSMIQSVEIYDYPLFVCMTGTVPCMNDLDSVGHSVSKTHNFIGSIINTVQCDFAGQFEHNRIGVITVAITIVMK